MIRTPKEQLENMVILYGYKGVRVDKISNDQYCIQSYNEIPAILLLYIRKNYYITCNFENTYLEFNEYDTKL